MNVSLGPLGYNGYENCILECLADQCQKLDGEEFSSIKNGQDLLKGIIKSLTEGTIQWPVEKPAKRDVRPHLDTSISVDRQEWIRKMEIDPNTYVSLTSNINHFDTFENLLIELSSRYLKRTIVLHPLFGDHPNRTFSQQRVFSTFSNSSEKTYNLLCVNKSFVHNVFWSVLKKTS